MTQNILIHNLGFPRIGYQRELKKALESYWAGEASEADLLATAKTLRRQNWQLQKSLGVDLIPSNDFSLYDHVLDTCALVGAIPDRFLWEGDNVDLPTYFAMARGKRSATEHETGHIQPATALEMTKWFDTNYHYLVPELRPGQRFSLASTKPVDEFREALELGIETVPVLLGPISFLLLGKGSGYDDGKFTRLSLLPSLLSVYENLLRKLSEAGAHWVQFDEPVLAIDLTADQRAAFVTAYAQLHAAAPSLKLLLATYFGDLRDNLPTAFGLPVSAVHLDLVRAPNELDLALKALPNNMLLSLGVVDGRNVWKNDFSASLQLLRRAYQVLGPERLMISPSCSLLHVPLSLKHETKLDAELKSWLAFAEEKLVEITTLGRQIEQHDDTAALRENRAAVVHRQGSSQVHDPAVKERCQKITERYLRRESPFGDRQLKQQTRFKLPMLPTTTIGSFPQTKEIRSSRARWKKGELSLAEYEQFLRQKTQECVRWQEEIGLDVPVHGEFERNDMVEYFGEQLAGFAFTANGWVQSYGSRCVKPPIIYGDVSRPAPMTVRWSQFAQSLTHRPMKGMLTGPITILQWSFVRNDQPRSETAKQIALAIRDEVCDLETAGICIIQIDEPALREGLPLRYDDRPEYLKWAVEAFRITASGVKDDTQIHTHMCYSEFNDIMHAIAALDADVISIETSRSNMELLGTFVDFHYPNEIGPGVWDIHSPRVPSVEEMCRLIKAAIKVIPPDRLWINPDCGLKTRRWEEVKPALVSLVAAAHAIRASL
jgi:5-methyltetrahydropteroyltriglutamate--homocysteine methyltransferase